MCSFCPSLFLYLLDAFMDLSQRLTGLCEKKQKEITKGIERAQIMGFMPVTYKDPLYLKDPEVCNIKYLE